MAQPVDWLGAFIEDEIRAVISWKCTPEIKQDPESRFSDDGSNYRSHAYSWMLGNEAKLQITEVLLTEDPMTVLVTDGFTSIKALLSEDVVATLEAEIGEKINSDTVGDIVCVREATVVSTPIGLSHSWIQLAISQIDYLYHLRKRIGKPEPIDLRSESVKLIDEIKKLRLQQYALDEEAEESSPDPLAANAKDNDRTPKSQAFRSSPPVEVQQSPNTQAAIATQVPTRRRPKGPTLGVDGFEVQAGANLDRPVQMSGTSERYVASPLTNNRISPANGTSALLSLLKQQNPEPIRQLPGPMRPPLSPASRQRKRRRDLVELDHQPPSQIRQIPQSATEPAPEPAAKSAAEPASIVTHDPGAVVAPPSAQPMSMSHGRKSSEKVSRNYSQRRIPRDQQKLLDRPSSWLPSLPGQQFPQPNVPIELLKRWNAQAVSQAQNKPKPDSPRVAAKSSAEEAQPGADQHPIELSSDSSTTSSSEDEEIPRSQWPDDSPVQKKPELPPDSTMDSSMDHSPVERRAMLPPNSSAEVIPRPSPVQTQEQALRPGSAHSDNGRPHLPMNSGLYSSTPRMLDSYRPSYSHRRPEVSAFSPDGLRSRPSSARYQQQSPLNGDLRTATPRSTASGHGRSPIFDTAQEKSMSPSQRRRQERLLRGPAESRVGGPPAGTASPDPLASSSNTVTRERPPSARKSVAGSPEIRTPTQSSRRRPFLDGANSSEPSPSQRNQTSSQQSTARTQPQKLLSGSSEGQINASPSQRNQREQLHDSSQDQLNALSGQACMSKSLTERPGVESHREHTPAQGRSERPEIPSSTVIKATQPSKQYDEDEMEVDVPRSLGQDPALAHRQRRSEHFRRVQRRGWIKQTLLLHSGKPFSFMKLCMAYKSQHSKDSVKASEFAEAFEEIRDSMGGEAQANTRQAASGILPTLVEKADNPMLSTRESIQSIPIDSALSGDATKVAETPARVTSNSAITEPGTRSAPPNQKARNASNDLNTDTPVSAGSKSESLKEQSRRSLPYLSPLAEGAAPAPTSTTRDEFVVRTSSMTPRRQERQMDVAGKEMESSSAIRSGDKAAAPPRDKQQPTSMASEKHSKRVDAGAEDIMTADPVMNNNGCAFVADPDTEKRLRESGSRVNGVAKHSEPRLAHSSVFEEFAQAWKSLKPGGAFARKREAEAPSNMRLDVLNWEL